MRPNIRKYDSFYANVIKETISGCIVLLEINAQEKVPAFAFGNYSEGDRVFVTVTKVFDDGRIPRVAVDSVIAYASDMEYDYSYYQYAA